MADELDAFFAKKAAKKGKKAFVQDTDSLARKLDKAVKHQEQIDRFREEEERITKERAQAVENQQVNEEDSEWIEVQPEVDVALTDNLHELDIDDIHVNDKEETPEIIEKPRTWVPITLEQNVEKDSEPEIVEKPQLPQKYVPPSRIRAEAVSKANEQPNLQDADQFPSLMAAEDISKKELQKKKLKAAEEKRFEDRERELTRKRQEALNIDKAEKEKSKSSTPEPTAASTGPAPAPTPGKYVPPHLRNKTTA